MTEEYWDGATWVYQATIVNGAGGAGNQTYTIEPGEGNELEVLYGLVLNGDTVSRTVTVVINDGVNAIARIYSVSLGAATTNGFPNASSSLPAAGNRFIVAGAMRLVATFAAVAASEDSAFAIACRIRGGLPTVTEAGASTPNITINTEQVF